MLRLPLPLLLRLPRYLPWQVFSAPALVVPPVLVLVPTFYYELVVLLQQFINMRLMLVYLGLLFSDEPQQVFELSFAVCALCPPLPLPQLHGDCLLGVLSARLCLISRWRNSQTNACGEYCLDITSSRSICL